MRSRNSYSELFIDNYIRAFRGFISDQYDVTIKGLGELPSSCQGGEDDLIERLSDNGFRIRFEGEAESICNLVVSYTNGSGDLEQFQYQLDSLPSLIEMSSRTDISIFGICIMKIMAQIVCRSKVIFKAIVLDLDETLWNGILSEDGLPQIEENLRSKEGEQFVSFMKFIKVLAEELGLFVSICTRNNIHQVESALSSIEESLFPIKNQIDYVIANDNNKGDNIKDIASHLNILPNAIVFIDDNPLVRDEVRRALPMVFVPEWSSHYELITLLEIVCTFERPELSINAKKRKVQFRMIENERKRCALPVLQVRSSIDESGVYTKKLFSRSNQFKFSSNIPIPNSRCTTFELFRINGDSLGTCSAYSVVETDKEFVVTNWAISCKYFGIGLEESILLFLYEKYKSKPIRICYKDSGMNGKVQELISKYPEVFCDNAQDDALSLVFDDKIIDKIRLNTNLELNKL